MREERSDEHINFSKDPGISEKTRAKVSKFIEQKFGIKMPESKKALLEGRLAKRLRALGFNSYEEYADFLFSKDGEARELGHFISVISTNKTDFFREANHFVLLVSNVLPELMSIHEKIYQSTLKVWSAGCSSGEEPYTLAMVIDNYLSSSEYSHYSFEVYATDISQSVLDTAVNAVYPQEKSASVISEEFKKKYLMHSKDPAKGLVKLVPELRRKVRFGLLNLMEPSFPMPYDMDIIFCRNVLIYFSRENQKSIIQKLMKHLRHGGFLFLGHSESITGLNLDLITIAPTIYRKA